MEISGRILREVEFRERLRGYDTDEVDEFLEKIAVAIEELLAELQAARETMARPAEPALDDESLRRTLVLAQRTADLAVREAREEAAALIEDARLEAGALTAEARDEAGRLRTEAEQDAQVGIAALEERRAALEQEIEELGRLVAAERARLSAALEGLSEEPRLVDESPGSAAQPAAETRLARPGPIAADEARDEKSAGETTAVRASSAGPRHRSGTSQPELADVEEDIEEDAETARGDRPRPPDEPTLHAVDAIDDDDPDEALWQRWARGADLDAVPKNRGQAVRRTPNRTERRSGGWSA
jgi:cell division initiation protein